jgi:AcrR family transcriptional regulator
VLAAEAREERRRNLIQAAWRCVRRKRFTDLTVDDVCEEAGVSKGSFYSYFDSKQDLLIGLLEDDAASMEESIERLSKPGRSGLERLEAFARAMLKRGEDASRVQVLGDLWAAVSSDDMIRQRFSETIRRRRVLLRSWIEEAVAAGEIRELPPNALAAIVLALGDALMLHASLDPAGFQWRNVGSVLILLLEGLRPPKA